MPELRVGWKKILSDAKKKYDQVQDQRRQRQHELDEIRGRVDDLLEHFEIPDLEEFLKKYLNKKPEPEVDTDDNGRRRKIPPSRKDYLDFIWRHVPGGEIRYAHLSEFAKKRRIVSPSFFRDAGGPEHGRGDFGPMIDLIRAEFEPEKISNEEHLESQLVIFLKAKFPGRKIDRQVTIIGNDRIDILVDGRYVLELKVPKQRSDLRNLGAQLEEYQERFPNICAIIFDDISNDSLSGDIADYVNKYRKNYGIPSVIVGGRRRS